MKKRMVFWMSVLLLVSALTGCGRSQIATTEETENNAESETEEPKENTWKTGLALMTSVSDSADASEEEGTVQADINIAAVVVDEEGKIRDCAIDSLQANINFNGEGAITTNLDSEFRTKQELGETYGMKSASSIGREWNEQADAFAEYCIGKTAEEINGIAVTDKGTAENADLASSCTIRIGGFQAIVTKAVENAERSDTKAGDKIGLGVETSVANSKSAVSGEEGLAQVNTTVAAVTTDADGKITSSVLDGVQVDVNFDASGKITSDLTADILSKNELGEDYGTTDADSNTVITKAAEHAGQRAFGLSDKSEE